MLPIFTLLIAVALALTITRVATVALTLTGLSQEAAAFQARSAYLGVGFTTSEAEQVVRHPIRRRIIMMLMIIGNLGLVAVVASVMLSFTNKSDNTGDVFIFLSIVFGLLVLGLAARSKWLEQRMMNVIERALRRWTHLETRDFENLLRLANGFTVVEFMIEPDHGLNGKTLVDIDLKEHGIIVLGIERADGTFLGAPRGHIAFETGDNVIAYGGAEDIVQFCSVG
jgi:hypothetical protein